MTGGPIHEGWLRKSPPLESQTVLFRPRWRKRWMVLVQGHHEDLYSLHYYTDETKSKLKGSIDLRHCMSISSNSVTEADKKSKQVKSRVLIFRTLLNVFRFRFSPSVYRLQTEFISSRQTTSSWFRPGLRSWPMPVGPILIFTVLKQTEVQVGRKTPWPRQPQLSHPQCHYWHQAKPPQRLLQLILV